MNVYHRTRAENDAAIRKQGFRDAEGQYMTARLHRGVWVSDIDVGGEDGGYDEGGTPALFVIDLPDAVFEKYEWSYERQPEGSMREALVPARLLNKCRVSLCQNPDMVLRPGG